jgi:hypothetical protein
MRIIFPALICFLLYATDASAQSSFGAGNSETPAVSIKTTTPATPFRSGRPFAAAKGKTIDVSLGYAYVSSGQSLSKRLGQRGADASFTIGFSRLGIKGDLGYARASNVLGTGHHSDVFKVSGPVRLNGGGILLGGWATGYAWAVGGGVDYWISDTLAIRTGGDYMRTAYYDPTLAVRGQTNLRTTASVVYFFGRRSRTWR